MYSSYFHHTFQIVKLVKLLLLLFWLLLFGIFPSTWIIVLCYFLNLLHRNSQCFSSENFRLIADLLSPESIILIISASAFVFKFVFLLILILTLYFPVLMIQATWISQVTFDHIYGKAAFTKHSLRTFCLSIKCY